MLDRKADIRTKHQTRQNLLDRETMTTLVAAIVVNLFLQRPNPRLSLSINNLKKSPINTVTKEYILILKDVLYFLRATEKI